MEKIAVGPKIGRVVSLSKTIEENLEAISKKNTQADESDNSCCFR
jgi:fructose-1,6-bisphosphatase/sedoheptulose 1,7-bisphosphatase-like protein